MRVRIDVFSCSTQIVIMLQKCTKGLLIAGFVQFTQNFPNLRKHAFP